MKRSRWLLKWTINEHRYPFSPRIGVLRGIMVKLEGPATGASHRCGGMSRHGTRERSGGHLGDNG